MKIIDLDASFVGSGGPGITDANGKPVPARHGIGVMLDCPCRSPECASLFVPFSNPLDGAPADVGARNLWDRVGDTLETLTLSPSIQRVVVKRQDGTPVNCAWHGFIKNGEIVNA